MNFEVLDASNRVSSVGLIVSMGVQVCHHGVDGHLVDAHPQLLLVANVCHQVEGASEV